jgi:hypothetical protein
VVLSLASSFLQDQLEQMASVERDFILQETWSHELRLFFARLLVQQTNFAEDVEHISLLGQDSDDEDDDNWDIEDPTFVEVPIPSSSNDVCAFRRPSYL